MKNIIQKFMNLFGFEIKKKDPFPNTFIPIDVLDPILFKLLSLNEKLKCILLSNENFLDGDIINKNLKKYKIPITNFEYIDFECQEFLNKDNNIIVIKNKNIFIDDLNEAEKKIFNQSLIILDISSLSKESIYKNNIFMLEKGFGVIKFWQYAIYSKNLT